MPPYQPVWTRGGFGWILALFGLFVTGMIWFTHGALTQDQILGLFALGFAALLF